MVDIFCQAVQCYDAKLLPIPDILVFALERVVIKSWSQILTLGPLWCSVTEGPTRAKPTSTALQHCTSVSQGIKQKQTQVWTFIPFSSMGQWQNCSYIVSRNLPLMTLEILFFKLHKHSSHEVLLFMGKVCHLNACIASFEKKQDCTLWDFLGCFVVSFIPPL